MRMEPLYIRGYLAGYRDGVRDSVSGNVLQWQENDMGQLPVQAMGLSSRACNCLIYSGCVHIKDVVALSDDTIVRMRNMGPKTAAEIAEWMIEHGILSTAWSGYLRSGDV